MASIATVGRRKHERPDPFAHGVGPAHRTPEARGTGRRVPLSMGSLTYGKVRECLAIP